MYPAIFSTLKMICIDFEICESPDLAKPVNIAKVW